MKKTITLLVCVCLLACGISAFAEVPSIDGLSQEELLDLRTRIDEKITIADKGTVIFDEDGFTIKWIGFDEDSSSTFKNILLVTNPTPESVYFEITNAAYNGIQISMANSFEYEIGGELTFITSTNNCWLFHYDDLALVGMTLEDITDVRIDFEIKDGDSWDSNVIKSGTMKFAIDNSSTEN